MTEHFNKVKEFLIELDYEITSIDEKESLFIVNNESAGICNLIIDCEYPILVIEQYLFDISANNHQAFKRLLQMNREIIHGAFALDETGTKVIFRDTLQLENLDLNELQGTLDSLMLLLCEFSSELIELAKQNK